MMSYSEPVWVELKDGAPYRILKGMGELVTGEKFQMMPRRDAVKAIRHEIFLRQMSACIRCGKVFTEDQMHLHERKFRSQGGEISLENSEGLCYECHLGRSGVHKQPKFTRRKR